MSNDIDIDLAEKKTYRRESLLRWKNKQCKTNSHFVYGERNTSFTTNDFSEQVRPSNLSSFVVNEITGKMSTPTKQPKYYYHAPVRTTSSSVRKATNDVDDEAFV
nr:glycoside hydrolase family 9 [Tanacetum cinerariifolium]